MANNRLPFGLCKKYGIELPKDATPHIAWCELKAFLEGVTGSPLKHVPNEWVEYMLSEVAPNGGVTQISDTAIDRVPLLIIPEYSYTECERIQSLHKRLLLEAREKNNCNEVAYLCRSGLSEYITKYGTDDSVQYTNNDLYGKGDNLFLMHNHPRNGGFSHHDILFFIKYDIIKSMSIVKSNGNVEVITKKGHYNAKVEYSKIARFINKCVKTGLKSEFEKATKKYLEKSENWILWTTR